MKPTIVNNCRVAFSSGSWNVYRPDGSGCSKPTKAEAVAEARRFIPPPYTAAKAPADPVVYAAGAEPEWPGRN